MVTTMDTMDAFKVQNVISSLSISLAITCIIYYSTQKREMRRKSTKNFNCQVIFSTRINTMAASKDVSNDFHTLTLKSETQRWIRFIRMSSVSSSEW